MDAFMYFLENTDNMLELTIGIVNFIIVFILPVVLIVVGLISIAVMVILWILSQSVLKNKKNAHN